MACRNLLCQLWLKVNSRGVKKFLQSFLIYFKFFSKTSFKVSHSIFPKDDNKRPFKPTKKVEYENFCKGNYDVNWNLCLDGNLVIGKSFFLTFLLIFFSVSHLSNGCWALHQSKFPVAFFLWKGFFLTILSRVPTHLSWKIFNNIRSNID